MSKRSKRAANAAIFDTMKAAKAEAPPAGPEPKIKPVKLDALDVAFATRVVGRLLPPMEEIPAEFKTGRHPWCKVFSTLFFSGGRLVLKPGIDAAALGHIKACCGSFEPSHEHKEAGVAYLMSLWCDESMLALAGPR